MYREMGRNERNKTTASHTRVTKNERVTEAPLAPSLVCDNYVENEH